MAKKVTPLQNTIRTIQYQQGLGLLEIYDAIDYSRQHINRQKKRTGKVSDELIEKLKKAFPSVDYSKVPSNGTYVPRGTSRVRRGTTKVSLPVNPKKQSIQIMQTMAMIKTLNGQVARLMAKAYGRNLEECLEDMDNNTKLNLKEMTSGR